MTEAPIGRTVALVAVLIVVVVVGLFGCGAGYRSYDRYQKRADAANRVKVNHINIRYLDQQKEIEQRKADIRVIHAIGIRKAQDHIAATLTPLYVSFEMTHAMQAIAESGKNNTVVFVPTNPATGVPIVPGITEKVGAKAAGGDGG